jgi:hypothetical protein
MENPWAGFGRYDDDSVLHANAKPLAVASILVPSQSG